MVLSDLDHFVKRRLKVPGYVRYVDDFFLFGDRRVDLRRWRTEVAGWLWQERSLRLKHPQARVLSCHGHLDALGCRVTRVEIRPHQRAVRRLQRKVEDWVSGAPAGTAVDFRRSMAARAGVLLF